MLRMIRIVATAILAAAVLLTACTASAFIRDPAPVFVNELHYDNSGLDQNEAVEIAGPAGTDLTGWRLVLYNGSDGSDYFSQELSGVIPDQGGGFPGSSRRGDVAPALPYMDLRDDGSDGGTPDLELVERTTSIGERHFGYLCTLLVWHEEDLVDEAERRRNDVVFAWHGNRNPFVDHPEWTQSIWSDGCG